MPTAEEELARLRSETVRLSGIVEAARTTYRDVRLERALIVEHSWALGEMLAGHAGANGSLPTGFQ